MVGVVLRYSCVSSVHRSVGMQMMDDLTERKHVNEERDGTENRALWHSVTSRGIVRAGQRRMNRGSCY